jgi:hypothetical protein
VGAHEIAHRLLTPRRYAHTRGVARQAARLARATHLDRARRRTLLAAAWLHDVGHGLGAGFHPLLGARALRAAGHERLARLVAHHGGAAFLAALLGLPPLGREFPRPGGTTSGLLTLIDIADLTSDADGRPTGPADRLRDLVARRSSADPSVRVMVSLVSRLGEDPGTRSLVELLAPRAGA